MKPATEEIRWLILYSAGGFAFAALLIVTYFRYDSSPLLKAFGNIFINFSLGKRDKRDILLFAILPFSIGIFALVLLVMFM